MNTTFDDILNRINSDDIIEKYKDKSTSCFGNYWKIKLCVKVSKELGLKDAYEYYSKNLYNDDCVEDLFEDQILHEILLDSDRIKNVKNISRWGLISHKRFTMIYSLDAEKFYKSCIKYSKVNFLPSIEVIRLLEQVGLLNENMVTTLIYASILEDDIDVLSWIIEKCSEQYINSGVRFNEGNYLASSRIVNTYLLSMRVEGDIVKGYVSHFFTSWNLTLLDYFNVRIQQKITRNYELMTHVYESFVRRFQKYNSIVEQCRKIPFEYELHDKFLCAMFINGDTLQCDYPCIKYLCTMNPAYILHSGAMCCVYMRSLLCHVKYNELLRYFNVPISDIFDFGNTKIQQLMSAFGHSGK